MALSQPVKDARGVVTTYAVAGVVLAALGGVLYGVTERDVAALLAVVMIVAGGLLLSVATVAWGVRYGMESVERP